MVFYLIYKGKEGVIHGYCNDYHNIMAYINYFVCAARMGLPNVCYDMWISICISGYYICCNNHFYSFETLR